MPRNCTLNSQICPVHGYIHGAEAEELRSRLESLIQHASDLIYAGHIEEILDSVDARDSCAYLEQQATGDEVI